MKNNRDKKWYRLIDLPLKGLSHKNQALCCHTLLESSLFKDCPTTFKSYFYLRASEKIAYKNLGVYCTFPFESAGFFQSIEFSLQRPLKELHFCI
jgi:hypothetical protein